MSLGQSLGFSHGAPGIEFSQGHGVPYLGGSCYPSFFKLRRLKAIFLRSVLLPLNDQILLTHCLTVYEFYFRTFSKLKLSSLNNHCMLTSTTKIDKGNECYYENLLNRTAFRMFSGFFQFRGTVRYGSMSHGPSPVGLSHGVPGSLGLSDNYFPVIFFHPRFKIKFLVLGLFPPKPSPTPASQVIINYC